MTPLQISILLHYHTRPGDYGRDHDNFHAPAVRESREWFVSHGLLEPTLTSDDSVYRITERGMAYVEGLCKVPLPENEWRIRWETIARTK